MAESGMFRSGRGWSAGLPLPAYFGVVSVLFGTLTWLFDGLQEPRHFTWPNLVLHLVFGVLFGAVMSIVVAVQRRRSGGTVLMAATGSALRTGTVPDTADRAVWAPLLERRLAIMRRSRWLSPLLLSPLVVFGIVAWVSVPSAAGPALGVIVVSVVVVLLLEVQTSRYIPRGQAALEELRSRPAGQPSIPSRSAASVGAPGRPWTVVAAVIACVVSAIAVLSNLVKALLQTGVVGAAARDAAADGSIPLARAEQLAGLAFGLLLTYWVVLTILLLLSGWFGFRGRNWARALLIATTLLTLLGLIAPHPLTVLTVAGTVVAAVLLYLPRSANFFSRYRKGSQ